MNEKFNKHAKVEKLTKKVGRGIRLIVIGPSNNSTFGLIKKGLRIGNINICHLLPKLDEIKLLMIFKQSTFLEYARHF